MIYFGQITGLYFEIFMSIEIVFYIAILVFSVIIHEVAHGVAAYYLGDMTAKNAGRLTLNPVPHIDPLGSLFLPAIMALANSPILFGWAKPVPYNPYNLYKGGKWGETIVAFAGPASNFALAIIFAMLLKTGIVPTASQGIVFMAVVINILLGVFNMIPIPPLDGSKILPSFLPVFLRVRYEMFANVLNANPMLGFGVVLLFVFVVGSQFGSFIIGISRMIAGI